MSAPEQSDVRNLLLRVMVPPDFALLRPHLRFADAVRGQVWFRKDEPIDTVWFMESGIGSLVIISPEGQRVEGGIWGREGFAPIAIVLGNDQSSYEGQVQMPGTCWTIPADALRHAVGRSPRLQTLLLRYVQTLNTQIAHTALCNALHAIDERLARWLLMCHDRIDGDELPLTHEFISIMLAVRRPSVTTALHVLEGNGFIRAERSSITIRDRAAMESFAVDGYGPPEREYERLIAPLR